VLDGIENRLKELIVLPHVEKVQVSKYLMSENRVVFAVDIEFEEGE